MKPRVLPLLAALSIGGLVRAGEPAEHPAERASEPAEHARPTRLPADTTESPLAALEAQENRARTELEGLGRSEQQLKRRLIVRGRVVYRLLKLGMLPAGGGFRDFVDHALRLGRARWALDQDLAQMQKLVERRLAVSRELEDLATRKAPLELERQASVRTRALLEEADDRRRAFERAFETSTGAGDYVAVYGGGIGPDDPTPGTDEFRTMKGRLPFPLAGRAEVRFIPKSAAGGPGVEMSASAGSAVRAVFAGRVAFADRYDPFGQVVILDHGDHYYTLLGNLGSVEVRVGDDLSAGARIGTVGQGPSGSLLYFEIRKGASTLDPKPWLGL